MGTAHAELEQTLRSLADLWLENCVTFRFFHFLGIFALHRNQTIFSVEIDTRLLIPAEVRAKLERAEIDVFTNQFAVHRFACFWQEIRSISSLE